MSVVGDTYSAASCCAVLVHLLPDGQQCLCIQLYPQSSLYSLYTPNQVCIAPSRSSLSANLRVVGFIKHSQ